MLRVGIIGLRHPHIGSLKGDVRAVPEAAIVAVAEGEPVLQEKAAQLGGSLYADYREMLDKERLDAVGVAAVNSDKGRVIAECLDRGLHVIVDKPLFTSLEDLEDVRRAWRRSGKILIAMLTLRYEAGALAMHSFVEEGGLGEPVAVTLGARRVAFKGFRSFCLNMLDLW